MSSELAKQLRTLQQANRRLGGAGQNAALRASFLFDEKEAAQCDADAILALARAGLLELTQHDVCFLAYETLLFSSASRDLERSLLTGRRKQPA